MAYFSTCDCDECGRSIDNDRHTICDGCWEEAATEIVNLKDEIEGLKEQILLLQDERDKFQECVVSTNDKWRSLGETCDEKHWHKEA